MSKFIECFLCGSVTLKENTDSKQSMTVFCTGKGCGRYTLTQPCLEALAGGKTLRLPTAELCHRVYMANRSAQQITLTLEDIADPNFS